MVSTDTADASEIVFAPAWALGYRWAPRPADLPDQRLWRIDREARYGPLNGLARNGINTRLITDNWDEIGRLTASLRAGTVIPSAILRTLQRRSSPSSLALPWPSSAGDQDPARARIRPRPGRMGVGLSRGELAEGTVRPAWL